MPDPRLLWLSMLLALAACGTAPPSDPQAIIRQAEEALGGVGIKTIRYTARGSGAAFGQAWEPGNAWPALNYSTFTRTFDFDAGAFGEESARSRAEPDGGGATPPLGQGETRSSGSLRDDLAWNGNGASATAAPAARAVRVHDLWTGTPQGAIRAARRYGATAGARTLDGRTLRTLTYTVPGALAATVLVDAGGLVVGIESTRPDPVLGDTGVVTRFSDYRDAAGMRFPMRIRQSQGGHAVLDLAVQEVRSNDAVDSAVPDAARAATQSVSVEPLAGGVWLLGGGSHNSVAIELAHEIVLVESPLGDGRAAAVFEAANRLVAGKSVRTVIATHHHFDHAGGLRYAAAEGATVLAGGLAKAYFDAAYANPNRIAPDRLAGSGRHPTVVAVNVKHVLADSTRAIEIHELQGSPHARGLLVVWLPRERLLIEADAYTPGPPGSAPPPTPNPSALSLAQNIERLNLEPERIVPLHGRVVPLAALYTDIGRSAPRR